MQHIDRPATAKAPASNFTGDVYVDGIFAAQEGSTMVVAEVRFTPCARTNWHSHDAGQLLYCTSGRGLVVSRDGSVEVLTPGRTVWTPPGEEHWHGATSGHFMAHHAMLEKTGDGDPTTWLEPVDDAEFERANREADAR